MSQSTQLARTGQPRLGLRVGHVGHKGSHEHGSSDYGRHEGKGSHADMAQAITAPP